VIYVFIVGLIFFAQPQKRKQKGKKEKKMGICPILFWAKNLKPKNTTENLLNVLYIHF
jgi:hypothetical protein